MEPSAGRFGHRQGRHARVLLAEDDDEFRELLARRFRERGFGVGACRHGLQLVEELDRAFGDDGDGSVDIVVTDIRLPGVSGLSVLAGLATFGNRCPVILMTGFGDNETHVEAMRLCASAVFDKPFEVDHLIDRVEQVLEAAPGPSGPRPEVRG